MSPWTAPSLTSQPLPATADVAVVGGGPVAFDVARGLVESGVTVVVLDRAPDVGAVGICQGTGHVFRGLPESAARLHRSVGAALCERLYRLSDSGFERLADAGLIQPGPGRQVASDDRERVELKDSAEVLTEMGYDAHFDGDALVGPADGMVDPVAATVALAREAQDAGATVVSGVVPTDWDGSCLKTTAGDITVEMVVCCGDLESLRWHDFFAPCLLPYREHALRVGGWSAPLERYQYGYFTLRPHQGGTVVRGARWATQHMEAGETDPHTLDVVQDKLDQAVAKRGVEDADVTHRWAWIETTTCDGLPFVGPLPGEPRVVLCTGFGSAVWGLGMGCAEHLVTALTGLSATKATGLEPSRMVL